jgi:hypothetical protein
MAALCFSCCAVIAAAAADLSATTSELTTRWLLLLLLLKSAEAQLSFVYDKALTSDLPLTAPPYLSAQLLLLPVAAQWRTAVACLCAATVSRWMFCVC